MAPNLFGSSATLFLEAAQQDVSQEKPSTEKLPSQTAHVQKPQTQQSKYRWQIVWRNVIAFVYLHLGSLYALSLFFGHTKNYTLPFQILLATCGAVGVTAGTHRLWCHRAYKAKWPLRFMLMVFQTVAFQNHIYEWVRDHRVHHKFTDSDADPHNSQRGFFFSHMGWLMVRKHPDVIKKGATVDMSDLDSDPIVTFQRRTYIVLMPVLCFLIPTWIPCYYWGERPMYSWYACIFRYTLSLHLTWLVNSAAHVWGTKPYDTSISATDNIYVAMGAFGEGWHNYHHAFPWDYKAGELGEYRTNFSTAFIDFFAKLGWAYDLKTATPEFAKKRARRTGDGSRYEHDPDSFSHEGAIWGWGDKDMQLEDIKEAQIINKAD